MPAALTVKAGVVVPGYTSNLARRSGAISMFRGRQTSSEIQRHLFPVVGASVGWRAAEFA